MIIDWRIVVLVLDRRCRRHRAIFHRRTQKFKSKDPSKLIERFLANRPGGLANICIWFDSIIDGYIEGFDKS
jgi:hypothetical protein